MRRRGFGRVSWGRGYCWRRNRGARRQQIFAFSLFGIGSKGGMEGGFSGREKLTCTSRRRRLARRRLHSADPHAQTVSIPRPCTR